MHLPRQQIIERLASTPGKRDGLYFPTKAGDKPSPLGPQVDAARAERMGLVNQVVPAGQQLGKAMEWARGVADAAPLVVRWLKESACKRGEKSMAARLANELLEASEGRGGAVKKRDEVHRMAEANKAFSHFRF